jgi:hypothetical protein
MRTSYEAPFYAVVPPLAPSLVQIFPSAPCSQTASMFSISVRDQVSHPYNTTGENVVLQILIFKFLERIWEDKIL